MERIEKRLDHDGPLPLYRQIASRLQYEIVTGAREPGERLASLRDAAESWGVNLHTVRRAYKELEAIGLVVMERPTGTRVALLSPSGRFDRSDLDGFLADITREARESFGLTGTELTRELNARYGDTPSRRGCVVECSRTLSAMLAEALEDRFGLDLDPRDLRERAPLPAGPVVGTWFHREELIDRLPDRQDDLHLMRIRPAQALLDDLRDRMAGGTLWSLILLDRHPVSAHNLAVDFRAHLGIDFPIEVRIPSRAASGVPEQAEGTFVLASPQTWDALPAGQRERPDVFLLRYEIYEADLQRLGPVLADRIAALG